MKNIDQKNSLVYTSKDYLKSYKYPLLITVIFFLTTSYVSFVIDNPARGSDALYYYFSGKQILFGDRENVIVGNAPIGGPVLFASLDLLFNDAFFTIKIVSLFSATAIVFLSYCIIKNIFNSKVALLGQLIIAINPFLHFQTTFPFNEMFPLFLIISAFYFISKKQLLSNHVIATGLLLGISFMFRYQSLLVFLGLAIFLLIRDNDNKKRKFHLFFLFLLFFILGSSPLFIYNYLTYDKILDSDPNFYLSVETVYQTPEWREEINNNFSKLPPYGVIFIDFDLFLKNYFYNLLYHNPNRIFSFTFNIENISPIPVIPFAGMIMIFGGLMHSFKLTYTRIMVFKIIAISISIILILYLIGSLETLFFAAIIIPLILLGIFAIKKIEKNFLPLLISALVFFIIISIAPINRPDYLFSIWIVFPTLTAFFILETIPKIFKKIINTDKPKIVKSIIATLILLIIISNLGFSYKFLSMIEYGDKSFDGIFEEFLKLFENRKHELISIEAKQIGELLSLEPNIESRYVMSSDHTFAYYANSKSMYVKFTEGKADDTIETYITRKNWSDYDYHVTNIASHPSDRYDIYKPIPDYLIFSNASSIDIPEYLKILGNPKNPKIPENFEVIYQSNKTGMIVYKINHIK